jgi:hypothetical protein
MTFQKVVLGVLFLCASSLLVLASESSTGKLDVKVGEEYYVCNCPGCDCHTISSKKGKCSCGNDLVTAKVTQVKGETAHFKADGWKEERPFSLVGKYTCACGPTCTCKTISQKPGTCGCGKELKKVGA